MTAVTTSVPCPMHAGSTGPLSCGGELVQLTSDFQSPTFTVAPCSSLLRQGWEGPQLVDFASRLGRYLPEAPAPVRHRDGLVTFGG